MPANFIPAQGSVLAFEQTISFTSADANTVTISIRYNHGDTDLVYQAGTYQPEYDGTVELISTTNTFTFKRTAGWDDSPFTLIVHEDAAGNVTETNYQYLVTNDGVIYPPRMQPFNDFGTTPTGGVGQDPRVDAILVRLDAVEAKCVEVEALAGLNATLIQGILVEIDLLRNIVGALNTAILLLEARIDALENVGTPNPQVFYSPSVNGNELTFTESILNNGTIPGTVDINLVNTEFNPLWVGADLQEGNHFTVTGTTLSPPLVMSAVSLSATAGRISFGAQGATDNDLDDSTSGTFFTFLPAAFKDNNIPTNGTQAATVAVNFDDPTAVSGNINWNSSILNEDFILNDGTFLITERITGVLNTDFWNLSFSTSTFLSAGVDYQITSGTIPDGLALIVEVVKGAADGQQEDVRVSFVGQVDPADHEPPNNFSFTLEINNIALFKSSELPTNNVHAISTNFFPAAPTNPSVGYGGITVLNENPNTNNGTVYDTDNSEVITCTLTNDTFAAWVATPIQLPGSHYALSKALPGGLTAELWATSATTVEVRATGTASPHDLDDSVQDITLDWLGAAFTNGQIPSDGTASYTFDVALINPFGSIAYTGGTQFLESAANDGVIKEGLLVTLTNWDAAKFADTFQNDLGNPDAPYFVKNTHYTITNVDAAFTANGYTEDDILVMGTSDSRGGEDKATLYLTGTPVGHDIADSIPNAFTLTWLDAAFQAENAPTDGSQTQAFGITYNEAVAIDGDITNWQGMLNTAAKTNTDNDTSGIGMNVEELFTNRTEYAFSNFTKSARSWESVTVGGGFDDGRSLAKDADGYPTSLLPDQESFSIVWNDNANDEQPAADNPGQWVIKHQGTGTMDVNSSAFNGWVGAWAADPADPTSQRRVFNCQAGQLNIRINATTPGDHVKNVRLCPIAQEDRITIGHASENWWNADYIDIVRHLGYVRFMQWLRPNISAGSREWQWTDRARATSYSFGDEDNVSIEYFLDLALEIDCVPWIVIPDWWNDESIKSLATAIRDDFPTDKQVIIEFCNELWNFGFFAHTRVRAFAPFFFMPDGTTQVPGFYQTGQAHARRAADIVELFGAVMGTDLKQRVHFSFGCQGADPSKTKWRLDTPIYGPVVAERHDSYGIAPYFGPKIVDNAAAEAAVLALPGDDQAKSDIICNATNVPGWPGDQGAIYIGAPLQDAIDYFDRTQAFLDQIKNITAKVTTYEGGPESVTDNVGSAQVKTIYDLVFENPILADTIQKTYLDQIKTKADFYIAYSSAGPIEVVRRFVHWEATGDDIQTHPRARKMKALIEWKDLNPTPW